MKKIFMLLVAGVLAFGLSAASSWYFGNRSVPMATATATALPNPSSGQASQLPEEPSAQGLSSTQEGTAPLVTSDAGASLAPGTVGTGEVLELARKLRQRLEEVRKREEELTIREGRLQVLYDDIRGEREALEALREQVRQEMDLLKQQLANVQQEQQKLSDKAKELERKSFEVSDAEAANVRKMAEMFESMPPESAALILEKMANNGNLKTAVQVLSRMNPRNAAKTLAAMADPGLAAQLSEQLKSLTAARPSSTP
jgi:flagellar motility protein MotE (MotC chaperone)